MPTYEYRCEACGHEFEKFQSITAPAIRKCPQCGKSAVTRLIGLGAAILVSGSRAPAESDSGSGAKGGAHDAGKGSANDGSTKDASTKPASETGTNDAGKAPADSKNKSDQASKPESHTKGGSTPETKKSEPAVDPERAQWKSKATHFSREGRGIGNMKSIATGRRRPRKKK